MRYAYAMVFVMAAVSPAFAGEKEKRSVNVFGPAVINCGKCATGVEKPPKPLKKRLTKDQRLKKERDELRKALKAAQQALAESAPKTGPISAPAPVQQTVIQTVNQQPPVPAPKPVPPPASTQQTIMVAPPAPAPKEEKPWWWVGGGMLMMGMYTGDRSDLLFGPFGEFGLRLGEYVRLSAKLGYSYAIQDSRHTLLIGGNVGVRLMEKLYLFVGLDTLWGGLDGLEAEDRRLLGTIGIDLPLTNWLAASVGFLFGERLEAQCVKENEKKERQRKTFDGGNYIALKIYFSSF